MAYELGTLGYVGPTPYLRRRVALPRRAWGMASASMRVRSWAGVPLHMEIRGGPSALRRVRVCGAGTSQGVLPMTPMERYLRLLQTVLACLEELLGPWELPDDPFNPDDWDDVIVRSSN
ncbi:hypothetical protein CL86_gp044 [Mycobacterium phage SkiPole]|uniref:Uncharacterized protein n=1 Tax=Mycobacterium phage SkiPole TaxID=701456 RepID=D2XRN8_9CAUD|nr:hypothetical protein CL86_gp044 [Mycobacterium phage SkiPole]ADA83770.1 hypothetical protein SKIPOLE_44 [Mycobacterium phage SkiPole]